MTKHASKTCKKCGVTKTLSHYYRHKLTADGRMGKCKPCIREDVAENRMWKAEHYRAAERARKARNPEARREYLKRYYATEEGAARRREAWVSYRVCHPERMKATWTISNAIRDGRLIREPCHCGEKGEAHIESMNPLKVRWLCRTHRLQHLQERRAA